MVPQGCWPSQVGCRQNAAAPRLGAGRVPALPGSGALRLVELLVFGREKICNDNLWTA